MLEIQPLNVNNFEVLVALVDVMIVNAISPNS